jgi:hypothetical protein
MAEASWAKRNGMSHLAVGWLLLLTVVTECPYTLAARRRRGGNGGLSYIRHIYRVLVATTPTQIGSTVYSDMKEEACYAGR